MKVPDPIIVVEVLSPSSVHMDTSAKLIGYFKLAERAALSADRPGDAHRHASHRGADGLSAQTQSSGALRLDPPGIALDIAELIGPGRRTPARPAGLARIQQGADARQCARLS